MGWFRQHKLGERWTTGIWLGKTEKSDEHILYMPDSKQVLKFRTEGCLRSLDGTQEKTCAICRLCLGKPTGKLQLHRGKLRQRQLQGQELCHNHHHHHHHHVRQDPRLRDARSALKGLGTSTVQNAGGSTRLGKKGLQQEEHQQQFHQQRRRLHHHHNHHSLRTQQ
jgi:hypothetical protein